MASEPPIIKTLRVLLGQHEAHEKILVEDLARAVRIVIERETQVSRSSELLEAAKRLVTEAKNKVQPRVSTTAEYLQQSHAFRLHLESQRQMCLERLSRDEQQLQDARRQAEERRVALAETKAKREAVAGRIAQSMKTLALAAENAADDEATDRAGRRRM